MSQFARPARARRGFTLVELLVVIAIIGVLVGLLLPAVQSAREAARKTQCKNNLKQLGLAVHNYESSRRELPPGYEYAPGPNGNSRGYSWTTWVLPFMELGALYEQIDFERPVFDNVNALARTQHIPSLLCPTDDLSPTGFVEMGDEQYAMSCYVANYGTPDLDEDQGQVGFVTTPFGQLDGPWGPFFRNSKIRLAQISDGTSKTLMVGERQNGPFRTPGAHGVHFEYETTWMAAVRDIGDPTDDHGHMVLFQTGHTPNHAQSDDRDVAAPHAGVAQFLLCDGSVHAVSEEIDLDAYQALGTINGGELLTEL